MRNFIFFGIAFLFFPINANSKTLADFEEILMTEDLSILRSEQQVNISINQTKIAQASLLPQVSASLATSQTEQTRFGSSQRYVGEDYAVVLRQSVFDRPRSLEVVRQRLISGAQEANHEKVRQERRFSLLEGYARWVSAKNQVYSLMRRLKTVKERKIQLDGLFASKRVSIVEVLTVENEVERIRSALAKAESDELLSQLALASLLGPDVVPRNAPRVRVVSAWPFGVWMDGLDRDSIDLHPLIVEALAREKVARIGFDQAESSRLPSINAEMSYRNTNVGANDTETFPTETINARLTMTWSIFDSGDRSARKREAELRVQDAEFALEQAKRELHRVIESSSSEMARIRAAWSAAMAEVESAEKLVIAADRSFELGVGTVADTLRALDLLVEAEIRLTTRWLEGLIAVARLMQSKNLLDRKFIELASAEFLY